MGWPTFVFERGAIGNDNTTRRWPRVARNALRAACLAASDIAAFVVVGALFRWEEAVPRILIFHNLFPVQAVVDIFYILGAAFMLARAIAGDYSRRQAFWDEARHTTIGLLIASIPCVLLLLFSGVGYSARAVLSSWAAIILVLPMFRHMTRWLLSKAGAWQLPTALIGNGPTIMNAYAAFKTSLSLGYDVRFVVSENPPEELTGRAVTLIGLHDSANIVARLKQSGCYQAVIVCDPSPNDQTTTLLHMLQSAGVEVAVVPPVGPLPLYGMKTSYVFGRELLLLHVRNNLSRVPSRIAKRLFDIVGSFVLLLALSPLLILIAWLVKGADRGPSFFIQPRVGRNGREFDCIKFRTMRPQAEEVLATWKRNNSPEYQSYVNSNFKLANDPRATPIGRWLRRTSLDELPQLLNVFAGDMSLVGPRPLLAREVSYYGSAIKLYNQTRPGITGLWQISGRSRTTFDDRIASDVWYIRNWSFWYDLAILLRTADVLLRRDGAF